jgi:uncharacterized membrane protein
MKLESRRARGQALPLFVLAVFALFAAVALVVDGGNLFAQQRMSQNAVDAAAYAGAITVAENIAEPGSRTDANVAAAVAAAAGQTRPRRRGGRVDVLHRRVRHAASPVVEVGGGALPATPAASTSWPADVEMTPLAAAGQHDVIQRQPATAVPVSLLTVSDG